MEGRWRVWGTLYKIQEDIRDLDRRFFLYRQQNTKNSEDDRFSDYFGTIQSIVTISVNNDSGMFETNLRDERFLPFEGAGAISEWSLELFSDLPANNPDPGNPDFVPPCAFSITAPFLTPSCTSSAHTLRARMPVRLRMALLLIFGIISVKMGASSTPAIF